MNPRSAIHDMEKGFWTRGADFYRDHVDAQCLVTFSEMAGVMAKAKVAASVPDGQRWKNLEIDEKGFLQPCEDTAIFTYEAHAVRPNGERYHALVSSVYVKRAEGWKLTFHQQTPMA